MSAWVHSNWHTYFRSWYHELKIKFYEAQKSVKQSIREGRPRIHHFGFKDKIYHPNAEIISANQIEHIQYANNRNIRKVLYDDFTLLKANIHSNRQDWSDDISIKRVYSVKALEENLCKARYINNLDAGDGSVIEMPTDFIKSNYSVDEMLITYTWSLRIAHQNSVSDREVLFRICGN